MVFWDIVPFSLVARYQHFRGTCRMCHLPEDVCSSLQRNVGGCIPKYMAA